MTRNIHNVSTTPAEAADNRLIEKEVYRSSRIRAGGELVRRRKRDGRLL